MPCWSRPFASAWRHLRRAFTTTKATKKESLQALSEASAVEVIKGLKEDNVGIRCVENSNGGEVEHASQDDKLYDNEEREEDGCCGPEEILDQGEDSNKDEEYYDGDDNENYYENENWDRSYEEQRRFKEEEEENLHQEYGYQHGYPVNLNWTERSLSINRELIYNWYFRLHPRNYKVVCTLRDIPTDCLYWLCWEFLKKHCIPGNIFNGWEAAGRAIARPRHETSTYFKEDDLFDLVVVLDRRRPEWYLVTEYEVDSITVGEEAVGSRGATGVIYDREFAFFNDRHYFSEELWCRKGLSLFDVVAHGFPPVLYGEEGFYRVFDYGGDLFPYVSPYLKFDLMDEY